MWVSWFNEPDYFYMLLLCDHIEWKILIFFTVHCKVNIRGPKEDVEKAKKLLVELSNEKQLTSLTAEVRAKPEHHKFLIGRQGMCIMAIRSPELWDNFFSKNARKN